MQHKLLSDKQWKHLQPLLPKLRSKGRPWADNRAVLEGILWVLKTGARWRDLPKEYPSASTCWRRLRLWEERDVWLRIWRAFLSELDQRGRLDWSESFLDASFAPAKKGASRSAKPAKAKVVADGKGIPLGSQLASAQAAEVKLAETTLEQISVPRGGPGRPLKRLLRVIADMAYDSDALRWRLLQRGIVLICPHRKGRCSPEPNDARTMRRYRKRWKIERTIAWLGNYRRSLVRHEHHLLLYQAFFHLACLLITLRHL